MKRTLCTFLFVFTLFAPSLTSHAESFNRIGKGIRNIGMGNVGIALSYDENALQYNPAGLIGVDEFFMNLGILTEVSDNAIKVARDLQDTMDKRVGDTAKIALGKKLYLRSMVSTNILFPLGFLTAGVSILGEGQVGVHLENPVLPKATASFQIDAPASTYGVAIPFGEGGFVLGLGARFVTRTGLSEVDLSADTLLLVNDNDKLVKHFSGANKPSVGQGYDIGLHWRVAGDWSLTIGAVAQNVGSLKFSRGGNKFPKDVPPEYSVGFSIQPSSDFLRFLYAFDIRDLRQKGTDDSVWTKRLHTGLELGILPIDSGASFIALRTGYNQGYLTYGAEINPFIFSRYITLQVATYAEETGEIAGGGKEARRLAQISFAF